MKINFTGVLNFPESVIRQNEEYSLSLNLPEVGSLGDVSERLAVVGGGATLLDYVDELREFDGDIFAINGTHQWLADRGVRSIFYSIDANPILASLVGAATEAVLSYRCHPSVFDALKGARIEVYTGEHIGPGSATTACLLGLLRGHKRLTFYGCNSDYAGDMHAAPRVTPRKDDAMVVAVAGKEFLTDPRLFLQAHDLAELIRLAPHVYDIRGGGLLQAMVEDPDYDVVRVSRALHETLTIHRAGEAA